MKKRLLSILLMCCMVLTLLPTAAFAEGSEEELPICTCETACTAESLNADCPVCGAEGALPENCAKCAPPEEEVSDSQPEGEASDPQPGAALTALSGEGGTPAAGETVTEVSTAADLTAAITGSSVNTVKLTANIDISNTLTVNRTVTLDLNGYVLQMTGSGSVIKVESSGNLTLTDSDDKKEHKFNKSVMPWALAADDATGENIVAVSGGVITGGKGYPYPLSSTLYCGGGVYIAPSGQLTMTGGNIIGCSAEFGGGVCIYPRQNGEQIQFSMSGGSIIGCVASHSGGGVYASGKFQMSGPAVIRNCTVESTDQLIHGGGVYVDGSFEMSGDAKIEGCQAISSSAYGGGVYVNSSRSFVMSENAKIENCQAISKSSKGGGVYLSNNTEFTLSGSAVIQNCTATNSATPGEAYGGGVSAANVREITLADSARIAGCIAENGSGLYITGSWNNSNYGNLYANGGSVEGDVVLGDYENYLCTITGTGKTEFKGKVTVAPGSTIKSGTFNGEVTNNGTITGGTFNGEVINNGTINDGVFTGIVSGNGKITGGTFNPLITGSGTETDPYQIRTAEGLKWFRDKVNNAKTSDETKICVVLTADIDLKNEAWTPIGIGTDTRKQDLPYSGTFDGNGHTISGLNVNYGDKNGGLFCYVKSATIKNLTVAGSVTYSSGDGIAYGGIVGCADSSTIENCTNRCNVTGNWYAGGIVGWAANTTITGCANFGNISISGFNCVGGICGYLSSYSGDETSTNFSTIRDCYNVGSISGIYAGGIAGRSYNGDNSAYPNRIANCYNMGKVTTTASGCAGEILGAFWSTKDASLDNCYYLDTAGNNAVGQSNAQVTNTKSMTAAEFADGTVLNLLKAGKRDNNADPWADECKYLDAAGKTLPVFKGQGDAHDHQSNDWEHNETEHWQVCTCGAVFHKAAHSGGKATCTAKAKCADCGAEYGDTNPNHHGDKLKHVVAKDATTREEGNIEYWHCEACGKYFSDNAATKEITQAETVIPKRQSSGSNYSYYTIKATAGTGGAISPSGNVSVREGRDQTFTITPDKGYAVANVKIDGKSIGAVKSYTFENVRRTHTIEVIFMKANGNPQTGVFVDVATGSYYEDAVDWAVENGITKGTDDTHFSPDGICTRAQAVTFLWRAAGSPEPETRTMPFTDVPAGSYYYDAVLWAVENGITEGTSDTTFSPNAICTRAQIVTFLWRSEKSPAAGTANPFADVKSTAYYAGAVLWAVREDITKGTTSTTFSPDADCTRAQIVTFLWRCKK